LIGASEGCVQELQASSLAKERVGKRRVCETGTASPTPHNSTLPELDLNGVKLYPIPLASPSDGLFFTAKDDAQRLRKFHGE
jgi:hypothetical protein